MQGWRGVDFAIMTSANSERSRWIQLLILAVVAIAIAHALDATAWRSARLLSVNDKDWGRLLRSMGYLPTWGVIAMGFWLQQRDHPRRAAYAWALILGPALGGGIAELLKLSIRRLRPNATVSLKKCPIASTRVAAHPAANVYHSPRARGYNCASTAAPAKATST